MFELSKQILNKVSFDRMLFKKELRKSLQWIKPHEKPQLKAWCLVTFGHLYQDIILEVFDKNLSPGF